MAHPENSRAGRRSDWAVLATGVALGVVVVALLVAAYAIGYNRGRAGVVRGAATAPPAAEPASAQGGEPAAGAGKTLFRQTCGGCHTLAAAGTTGAVGPSLDALRPSKDQVLAAIAKGGLGTGQMPPGLLSDGDAQSVAELVSSSAGR